MDGARPPPCFISYQKMTVRELREWRAEGQKTSVGGRAVGVGILPVHPDPFGQPGEFCSQDDHGWRAISLRWSELPRINPSRITIMAEADFPQAVVLAQNLHAFPKPDLRGHFANHIRKAAHGHHGEAANGILR